MGHVFPAPRRTARMNLTCFLSGLARLLFSHAKIITKVAAVREKFLNATDKTKKLYQEKPAAILRTDG